MTRVIYVPGARNHYKYNHDVVVLDEQLKAYPKAHDYIREHELAHARHNIEGGRSFRELVKLEIVTDAEHYFADGETMREMRRYFKETGGRELTRLEKLKFNTAHILRGLWNVPMQTVGPVYRALRGAFGRFRGGLRG